MTQTVHQLRKNGYDVKIRHVREFIGVDRDGDDEFMTRGEYECARQSGELIYQDAWAESYYRAQGVARGIMPSYSRAVSPINGWTEVTVISTNGQEGKGKYSFTNKPFNREIGLCAALGRALKQLYSSAIVSLDSVKV